MSGLRPKRRSAPMTAERSPDSPGTSRGARPAGVAPAADGPESPVTRPLLPRGLLLVVGIAAALVAALGLRAFSDVVAPVFLGLVLSITVQPLRRLPARHR